MIALYEELKMFCLYLVFYSRNNIIREMEGEWSQFKKIYVSSENNTIVDFTEKCTVQKCTQTKQS